MRGDEGMMIWSVLVCVAAAGCLLAGIFKLWYDEGRRRSACDLERVLCIHVGETEFRYSESVGETQFCDTESIAGVRTHQAVENTEQTASSSYHMKQRPQRGPRI